MRCTMTGQPLRDYSEAIYDDGLDGLPDTRILAGRSLTVPWACELPKDETFLQVEVSPDWESEEAIFAGVPINVTLLFSREHYLAAAEAYLRGLERRLEAGLNLAVCSVASLFISRWDKALPDYAIGYLPRLNRIRDLAAACDPPVRFVGNYLGRISLPDCIRTSGETAGEIIQRFKSTSSP